MSAFVLAINAVAHDAGLSIGLNFGADEPSSAAGGTLTPSTAAGVLPQVNWNNLTANNGSSSALVADLRGTSVPSTATVTWSCPNTWSSTGRGEENNQFPVGSGDRALMLGYLDSNDQESGAVHVTVSNLDASFADSAYDVIVYALGGTSANRYGAYSINGVTNIVNSAANPTGFVLDPGLSNTDFGNYIVFKNVTGSSFELIANAVTPIGNGVRAPVSAIQIVRAGSGLTAVNVGGNAIGTMSEDGDGAITIVGGGNDIWDMSDEFTYAYGQKAGDFDVQVRVDSLTFNGDQPKAGIMVRESGGGQPSCVLAGQADGWSQSDEVFLSHGAFCQRDGRGIRARTTDGMKIRRIRMRRRIRTRGCAWCAVAMCSARTSALMVWRGRRLPARHGRGQLADRRWCVPRERAGGSGGVPQWSWSDGDGGVRRIQVQRASVHVAACFQPRQSERDFGVVQRGAGCGDAGTGQF
ncbi:MAG: hypothetical protein IPK15_05215 [Verrucomicrobia bacterium]|nr:hypothetical protein [Verrucomicrobiota bacterium]